MKKYPIYLMLFLWLFLIVFASCKKKTNPVLAAQASVAKIDSSKFPFDSTQVAAFFDSHPLLKKYQPDVKNLYQKQGYHYVWHTENGINEFANVIHNKINNLGQEGILAKIPYKPEFDLIYEVAKDSKQPNSNAELLTTALYFFYIDKVYHGLDTAKSEEMEWFLPREKQSYEMYTDSLLVDLTQIKKDKKNLFGQYYLLKEYLKKYRKIEQNGGWDSIVMPANKRTLQEGDSAQAIVQLRNRLYATGEITTNSKSAVYDAALAKGVLQFKKSRGNNPTTLVSATNIKDLNTPVTALIKTIVVNMERCRWISKNIAQANELIAVNIPAYELTYIKNKKVVLTSNVVVGKTLNKTVIFSAPMKYIVFSPYWNVPNSIIQKEILPAMKKNRNYLAKHNMEWNNGRIRQKPGPRNSLGLVKFLFPNSNAIYLHDTPSKHLFSREKRAFSHGCIRVEKPTQLANKIMEEDTNWTPEKVDQAMHSGKETWYTLKNKIPVFIGYFTSWVDSEGTLHFYEDVYNRDAPLAALLFEE
ncbi:L,D-transpeptidase family protein [Flavobacterium crassostreae]|uniref:L,D-transpeptidase YcbB n=1 Tax=Flavobacterium crassostreae TaxID=1763534 RepID=A0A1B9DXD8_9FLAO|nr:L,D-transpeptidase family protein [Flavobacterium crassostreae]OCB74345.1 l,D-transpeptidase YcbB [Flavobacterium crassostreae]